MIVKSESAATPFKVVLTKMEYSPVLQFEPTPLMNAEAVCNAPRFHTDTTGTGNGDVGKHEFPFKATSPGTLIS